MLDKTITLEQINTRQAVRDKLRKDGWTSVPVVTFGNLQYAILWHDTPHPGHNTAEVINITEFNHESPFKIPICTHQQKTHTDGTTWVIYVDEGMGVLTVYTETGALHMITHPYTAVLSYRISTPTPDDIRAIASQLDTDLQEHGIRRR